MLFIAGGVEHMTTRTLWVISKTSAPGFGGDAEMHDSSFGWRFVNQPENGKDLIRQWTEWANYGRELSRPKYGISPEKIRMKFAAWSQHESHGKAQRNW